MRYDRLPSMRDDCFADATALRQMAFVNEGRQGVQVPTLIGTGSSPRGAVPLEVMSMEISGKTAIVTGAASASPRPLPSRRQRRDGRHPEGGGGAAAHLLSGTNKQVLLVRIDVTQDEECLDVTEMEGTQAVR